MASCILDHYAVSPLGLTRSGGRFVLRVVAYQPRFAPPQGLRVCVQACTAAGKPIAEDPLLAVDQVHPSEVEAFLKASEEGGWVFIPRLSRSRVSLSCREGLRGLTVPDSGATDTSSRVSS